MGIQWTLIASFLYLEIALVLVLVLPIASPKRWQRLFKSRMLQFLGAQASWYFMILLVILVIFLLDAIREIRKYSDDADTPHTHLDAAMQNNMRLFRAQRNLYISGFALFLSLVIRRLVALISQQATLLAQAEVNFKQAQSATNAARAFLDKKEADDAVRSDADEETDSRQQKLRAKLALLEDELAKVKEAGGAEDLIAKVARLEGELEKEKKDKAAVKSQAEGLSREFDRLTEEYARLQNKQVITAGSKTD